MLVKSGWSRFASVAGFCLLVTAVGSAQVNGSGATGTIPVFTGASAIGNSVITQSGNYWVGIGIGTPVPNGILEVSGFGRYISTAYNYRSVAEFSGGAASNNAILFNTGATASTTSIRGLAISSSSQDFSIARFDGATVTAPPTYDLTVISNGNVGIGTTAPSAKLEINGNLRFSGDATGTVQTTAWTGVLCGGDYAESVDVTDDRKRYETGDVLVIDAKNAGNFIKSSEPYSMAVTGVYSSKPGVVGRRQTTVQSLGTGEVPMAMVGIVPTKVSAENGPIKPGDILVSSSTPGHAMKGTDRSLFAGAVIGKALGSLDSGTGVIEVVVSLQ